MFEDGLPVYCRSERKRYARAPHNTRSKPAQRMGRTEVLGATAVTLERSIVTACGLPWPSTLQVSSRQRRSRQGWPPFIYLVDRLRAL